MQVVSRQSAKARVEPVFAGVETEERVVWGDESGRVEAPRILVAKGANFEGAIKADVAIIEGTVNGRVAAARVEVYGSGVVIGEIHAQAGLIKGRVEGLVHAKDLAVTRVGRVAGAVMAERLSCEPGSVVDAPCVVRPGNYLDRELLAKMKRFVASGLETGHVPDEDRVSRPASPGLVASPEPADVVADIFRPSVDPLPEPVAAGLAAVGETAVEGLEEDMGHHAFGHVAPVDSSSEPAPERLVSEQDFGMFDEVEDAAFGEAAGTVTAAPEAEGAEPPSGPSIASESTQAPFAAREAPQPAEDIRVSVPVEAAPALPRPRLVERDEARTARVAGGLSAAIDEVLAKGEVPGVLALIGASKAGRFRPSEIAAEDYPQPFLIKRS